MKLTEKCVRIYVCFGFVTIVRWLHQLRKSVVWLQKSLTFLI